MMLTKNEAAYIAGFLEELDNEFGNAGCNDMYLPDTPENRQMYTEAERHSCGEDALPVEEALGVPFGSDTKEEKISTNNQTILGYLKKRLMDEYKLTDKDIPNTASW